MNYGIVTKVLGNLLMLEAFVMLPSLFISMYFRQADTMAFAISIFITCSIGYIMKSVPNVNNKSSIKAKEGFVIVSLGWIFFSFFGSMPFIFSGSIPSIIDAFFETVSGFTTTGATIIEDIEILPKGILFWRSFTHWIGGMGILVFTVAILPTMGVGSFKIYKAESPGPIHEKIVPRVKETAKILYTTYITITILEIVLLSLGGMSLYESMTHTFGTVGTGGFSTKNASVGAFDSTYIHIVISIFMIIAGTNFSLLYELYKGKWRDVLKNEELRLYLGIIAFSVVFIAININTSIYNNIGRSFEDSFFQVSSIITTTGYGTANFDEWPTFSKGILFLLMFIGGCAGSTGGGIKNIRILVLLKLIKREMSKIFHPRAIISVKLGQKIVPSDTLASIASFLALYLVIFSMGTLIISLEGIGLVSSASAVVATLSNIGPGFDFVGPTQNYAQFSSFSKLFLSWLMLLGRLELFTMFILLNPKFWTNKI